MYDMPPRRHGFRVGLQWISESSPRRWTTLMLSALALSALALFIIPWNTIFPPTRNLAPVPVAHVQPAPSPTATPTEQIIQVNGARGELCVVPTSKVRRPVTLVKVP
jgi:hypothetical protein